MLKFKYHLIGLILFCFGIVAFDSSAAVGSPSLWPVLASHFQLSQYDDHIAVQKQVYWFTHHSDFMTKLTKSAQPYIYYIFKQTQQKHMPAEIALIPMVESEFNPMNYSTAGAEGLWQLMPQTAYGYGIKMNHWYDGRKDVIRGTQISLYYLSYLYKTFKDNWLLAIAAYDAGEGTVLRAIQYNKAHHRPTDFWDLPLPTETRLYVPRLLAIADVLAHASSYHVPLEAVSNKPFFGEVSLAHQMTLTSIAKKAHVPVESVRALNPAFKHFITPPNTKVTLLLPLNSVPTFTANEKRSAHG